MVHGSSNLTRAKPGPFFNGRPTLFARKTVLLLVRNLFQNVLKLITSVALERANLIIIREWIMGLHGLCYVLCVM